MRAIDAVLPQVLRPEAGIPLVWIGPPSDGGYAVAAASILPTRHVLGLGLSDDWRFEAALSEQAGCGVTIYDHTVTTKFWAKRRLVRMWISLSLNRRLPEVRSKATLMQYRAFFGEPGNRHIARRIGYDADGCISIGTALDDLENESGVFLKCDIEGSEWRSIEDIGSRSERLTGVVVEFHDVDLHIDRLRDLIERLQGQFAVARTSVNNFGPVTPQGVPHAVEVTLVPRRLLDSAVPGNGGAETPEYPNNPAGPTVRLSFADQ